LVTRRCLGSVDMVDCWAVAASVFVSNFRRIFSLWPRVLRGFGRGKFRHPRRSAVTAGPDTEDGVPHLRREGNIERCHREL
jgi:hypothetical protein